MSRWTIAAFVLAALAVVLGDWSILLGPLAVSFAVVGRREGDPMANRAIVAGIAGMVLGLLIGELRG